MAVRNQATFVTSVVLDVEDEMNSNPLVALWELPVLTTVVECLVGVDLFEFQSR